MIYQKISTIYRRIIMIIKNGIVADPASGLYEHMDILVKD